MTTTYRIVGKTNGWIASRDTAFNGKTERTFEKGMTLAEAKSKLLDWFNHDHDTSFPNWGVAMNSKIGRDSAWHQGNEYGYEWDSRSYYIEEEESWTYNYIVELNGQPVESGEVTFRYEEDEQDFIEKMNDRYIEDRYEDEVEVLFR